MKNLLRISVIKIMAISVLFFLGPLASAYSETIVVNGDFSSGNTGFSSDYTYKADIGGINNELEPEGCYGVGYNAFNYHSAWLNAGDHTSGSGQMFIANGSSNTSSIVWQGTVNQDLVIGTTYDFSAWMIDLWTAGAHASLTFKADGVNIGTLTLSSYQTWVRLTGTFTAQSLRPTFTLTNAVSEAGGNDFAVDDINIFYEGTTNLPSTASVTTSAATSVATTSASLGGNVTADGGFSVTERGVVYSSTDTEPYIGDVNVTKDDNDSGTGPFSETISSLVPGTTYYFQAYATNSAGTNYGGVLSFTTDYATITFTDGSGFFPSIAKGSANQVLGNFTLVSDVDGPSLTAASIQLNGTRTGLSNIKLWGSADGTFESGSDTQLGSTVAADPGDGGSASFSAFSNPITTSNVYYFITGDVASNATGVVQGVIVNNSSFTIASGTLSGPISNAALSNGDASLPVELVSFSATRKNDAVELTWTTASEIDNLGFIIERRSENGEWLQITSYLQNEQLTGQGTTQSSTQYSFNDAAVTQGTYTYRLSEVNTSGQVNVLSTTSVEMAVTPTRTQLFAAYPNPFNPQTTLKYQLSQDSHVTLAVFDVLGRQIKLLANQQQTAGEFTATWDGTNEAGLAAPSGTYLVRLQAGKDTQTNKILYIK